MKGLVAAFTVVLVVLCGCSGGLSRKAAGRAIEESGDSTVSITVSYGRLGTNCEDEEKHVRSQNPTTDIVHVAASAAGLIQVTPDVPDFWKVELTGGKSSQRPVRKSYHFVANGCDYELAFISLANKSVVAVTSVNQLTDDTAEAEYAWKWVLTPAGEKIIDQVPLSQLAELDAAIDYNSRHRQRDSNFALADVGRSTELRRDKVFLKKTNGGWKVAE